MPLSQAEGEVLMCLVHALGCSRLETSVQGQLGVVPRSESANLTTQEQQQLNLTEISIPEYAVVVGNYCQPATVANSSRSVGSNESAVDCRPTEIETNFTQLECYRHFQDPGSNNRNEK